MNQTEYEIQVMEAHHACGERGSQRGTVRR